MPDSKSTTAAPKKTTRVVIRETPEGPVTMGISLRREKVEEVITSRSGEKVSSTRTVKEVLAPGEYREVPIAQFKTMRKLKLVEEYDPEIHENYRDGDSRGPLFESVATPPRPAGDEILS